MISGISEIRRLNERFIRQAEQARERAKALSPGPERDALLKRVRQAEMTDRWLSSSELLLRRATAPAEDSQTRLHSGGSNA
jgi:hypothetical protein